MHRFLRFEMESSFFLSRIIRRLFFLSQISGFTLIELLVVIAILAVLAAGVLTAINPFHRIGQANDTKIKSDVGQIANAMQAYYVTHQAYPAQVSDLIASGDLKTEPKTPQGTSYSVQASPSGCTTTANDCTSVIISAALSAPQTINASWQWNSASGLAGEIGPTPTLTPIPPTSTPTPTLTPTPTPTPTPVNNLMQNWSFEDGTAWTLRTESTFDSTTAHGFTRSLKLQTPTTNTYVPQTVTIPSAGAYRLWAWIKTQGTLNGSGIRLYLNGGFSGYIKTAADWTLINTSTTFASSTSTQIQLQYSLLTGDVAWLDDIVLEKCPTDVTSCPASP